jgi:hypothetical protein
MQGADAGDAVSSSRSGHAENACPPPRPFGLRPGGQQQNANLFLRRTLGIIRIDSLATKRKANAAPQEESCIL